jgi:hypothetical protein
MPHVSRNGGYVQNRRIVYIQTDPHGGACGVKRDGLGNRYQSTWPEIIHSSYSSEPKKLIVQFLKEQITKGVRVEWSQKFLAQIETS